MPVFTDVISEMASDDELHGLQMKLMRSPRRGKVVQGTGGARKIRLGVAGRGKRGTGRVVYYYQDRDEVIWMLTAYMKRDKSDLSFKEKKALQWIINQIKGNRP